MHHVTPGAPGSLKIAKAQAKRLRAALNASSLLRAELVHGHALELVAKAHGFESWGHLVAATPADAPPGAAVADDPNGPQHGLVSAGYLFRLLLRVSGEALGSPTSNALLARMAEIIPLSCGDSAENRKVCAWVGADGPLPWEATLVPTRGFRFIGRSGSPFDDLTTRGLEVLDQEIAPNQNMMSRRSLFFTTSDLPGVWSYWEEVRDMSPAKKAALLDGQHALVKSFTLSAAMIAAREVDPDLLPLVGPGGDCEKLLARFGLPGVQMRLPGDALPWLAGLLVTRAKNAASQGDAAASARPVSAFVSAAEMGGPLEALLAQTRSLGLHLFVWPDNRMDRDYVSERVLPNVGSVVSTRASRFPPRVARRL